MRPSSMRPPQASSTIGMIPVVESEPAQRVDYDQDLVRGLALGNDDSVRQVAGLAKH
ncbi:MAG: hypothetical protein WBV90_02445 [Terrimicrobiaceae bacterium]